MVVVVVAAIIRILLVRLGKFVMRGMCFSGKKTRMCVLHFSFPLCVKASFIAIEFDIHNTRYDARDERQDARNAVSEFVGFDRQ